MSFLSYDSVPPPTILSPGFTNCWIDFDDDANLDEVSESDVDATATIIAIKVPYQNYLYRFSTRLRESNEKTVFSSCGGGANIIRAKCIDENVVRFRQLLADWKKATMRLSSLSAIVLHPAYQQIIGMGKDAVPLLLAELKENPTHLFWALKAITGADPVSAVDKGKVKKMAEAWLSWGRQNGYTV